MSKPKTIAATLSNALPPRADARDELIALGMIATGVICQTPAQDRAKLVDTFCELMRKGVASAPDMN